MTQSRKIKSQRKVVLEELKRNSNPITFELLSDILSIEREHKDNKHGVKEAIRTAIERTAQYDLSQESE